MQEQYLESKIVNYDSIEQISKIIEDNFSEDFLLVRHNQHDNTLFFKKLPTTKTEV